MFILFGFHGEHISEVNFALLKTSGWIENALLLTGKRAVRTGCLYDAARSLCWL